MKLAPTANPVPEQLRRDEARKLQVLVEKAIETRLHVKAAHWNVQGENFGPLHKLFDKVAADLDGYTDAMAERAAQFGLAIQGGTEVGTSSKLVDCEDACEDVANRLADLSERVYAAMGGTDLVTQDVLIEVARGLDAWIWKVERHIGGGE